MNYLCKFNQKYSILCHYAITFWFNFCLSKIRFFKYCINQQITTIMKQLLLIFCLSFFVLSLFSQNSNIADTVKVKGEKLRSEKVNNQKFEWDSDDIYAGKSINDSIRSSDTNYSLEEEDSDEVIHRKHRISSEIMDVVLNVGLILFWIFAYY